ncbi:hypothetical protein Tco_1117206 [Tanacetum coccineum]
MLIERGLQLLANSLPTAKLNLSSANTVNTHIQTTVQQISNALGGLSPNVNTSTSNIANSASVASADDGNNIVGGFDEPPTPVPTESSPSSKSECNEERWLVSRDSVCLQHQSIEEGGGVKVHGNEGSQERTRLFS